jgi:iron complex transport system ATP-binding protein
VLPQELHLAFPFRVHEVVLLGRSPHAGAGSRADDLQAVDAALQATDTRPLADRLYPTLSGGEKQRVHLARALAQIWRPEAPDGPGRYLLMDEPTNNLDLRHQHTALRMARRCAAAGVGVLAILHDINLAAAFADRICLLRQGRIVALGPTAEMLAAAPLEAAFDVSVTVLHHPSLGAPQIAWTVDDGRPGTQRPA